MNTVTLVGRLTRDPEDRQYEKDGEYTSMAKFRLAVERNRNDGTDFFDVTAFGSLGALAVDHLTTGRLVGVVGRLHSSEWTASDGTKRHRVEVIAETIRFLDRPKTSTG
jgi:single-strand DNA-binding protein